MTSLLRNISHIADASFNRSKSILQALGVYHRPYFITSHILITVSVSAAKVSKAVKRLTITPSK
jgi:hypothetical protein